MDELFRFVALRPPTPTPDAIALDGDTPLAAALAEARNGANARNAMSKLAQSFVRSDDFIQDPSTLNLPLDQLADALDQSERSEGSEGDLIERVLGASAAHLVDSSEFAADVARLQDTLLAFKVAPPEGGDAATVLRMLSAADVMQRIASDGQAVRANSKRLVVMPPSIFPLPAAAKVADPVTKIDPAAEERQRTSEHRAAALREALQALTAAGQLLATTSLEAAGQETESVLRPLRTPQRAPSKEPQATRGTLLLDKAAVAHLSANVREILADLRIDPLTTPLPAMLKMLSVELGNTERTL